MNSARKYILIGLFLFITGCNEYDMKPLIIPDVENIIAVKVNKSNSNDIKAGEYIDSITITDAAKLSEIIILLMRVNKDMRREMFTYPTPTHSVIFEDRQDVNLLIFFGKSWIGGRNNVEGEASEMRLTKLDGNTRLEFLNLLGITSLE